MACCDACAHPHAHEQILSFRASGANVREQRIGGEDFISFDMIPTIAGVRQAANSLHPELLPDAELRASVSKFEGLPIVYKHSMQHGRYVSVHAPHDPGTGLLLGFQSKPRMDSQGRIKVRGYISLRLAAAAGDEPMRVVQVIRSGGEIEVSVTHFAAVLPIVGISGGKPFIGVHTNIRPDQTAIMPLGHRGACSNDDGCGIRS